MAETLPPSPNDNGSDRSRGSPRFLAIKELHYHPNDITELRKLAEISPELASKVIDSNDKADSRVNTSYRFGLVSTAFILLGALAAFSFVLVTAGILATAGAVAMILAVALLTRVVLTGEWSDTSWFGRLVTLLTKALGGSDQAKAPDEPDDSAETK